MLTVGLTGGIACGKSVVSNILIRLGVPVYDSDSRAKYIMETDKDVKDYIIKKFGRKSFLGKNINIGYIADNIFGNSENRATLNKIVHNAVIKDFNSWKSDKNRCEYVVMESAILFETGYNAAHNRIINVVSTKHLRSTRLRQKGLKYKDIVNRINSQWDNRLKAKLADFVIINNEIESVILQTLDIHYKLNKMCKGDEDR